MKETFLGGNLWGSIEDMPIYNWVKIMETGDLKWMFIKNKGRVSERVYNQWVNLQQEYLEEFGLDERAKQTLRHKKRLIELNTDFVITGDRHLLNLIAMTELDLKNEDEKEAVNFYQMLDYVEKYKGFAIDPKKTSVIKWYYTLKNITDGQAD